jgi:bifunctional UDP-N-acetylglucosamine pyrophosphorylase/glucosamine-1-phosphate N-acetyltransferase
VKRVLIIPAAGRGSRLGSDAPKALVPVLGRPMLAHLLALYGPRVSRVVVVVSPGWDTRARDLLQAAGVRGDVAVQGQPTGMLDAILAARPLVVMAAPQRVWITWCDQVAVRGDTLDAMMALESAHPAPAIVMPTCASPDPYVHFDRRADGRLIGVRHRREGDPMPEVGEGDIGVFSLSCATYLDALGRYDIAAGRGSSTGERNFLPFIPWLAAHAPVATFPCTEPIEAVGINTVEELARVEAALRTRAAGPVVPDEET